MKSRLTVEQLEDRQCLATFVVTNLDDAEVMDVGDAPGTLRQAIFDANQLPSPDVITFEPGLSGTITIENEHNLRIEDSVEIRGSGTSQLQIENTRKASSLFVIRGDATVVTLAGLELSSSARPCGSGESCDRPFLIDTRGRSLTISDVRMTEGPEVGIRVYAGDLILEDVSLSGFSDGIEISTDGNVVLKNVSIQDNAFTGIIADNRRDLDTIQNRTISLENTVIEGNQNRGLDIRGGSLEIVNSTIANNSTRSSIIEGAGLRCSCELTIHESVISGNRARHAGGMRIWGTAAIHNSTISDNAADRGAGIVLRGELQIHNSTISNNTSHINGAGILVESGNLTLSQTTITGNTTSGQYPSAGGGILQMSGTLTIDGSIVAHNDQQRVRRPAARDISVLGDDIVISVRNSLIGDVTGTDLIESPQPDENGNILGGPQTGAIDPKLGPLAYNGGPTLTHQLFPDSPAVDAGRSIPDFDEYDQRGEEYSRIFNGVPDMGAFELQAIPGDFDGDYIVGCGEVDQLAAAVTSGGDPVEMYDLTGDGLVDDQDMEALLTSVAIHRLHSRNPVLPADANLDGTVDVSDFNIWNSHRFTEASGICRGDFNLDGLVDGADWSIWSENRFQSIEDEDGRSVPVLAEESTPIGQRAASRRSLWKYKLYRRRDCEHKRWAPILRSASFNPDYSVVPPAQQMPSSLTAAVPTPPAIRWH